MYYNKNLVGSHGFLPWRRNGATCRAQVPGGGRASHISVALSLVSESAFICCPRTPTEPIRSPALLSSSAAASCVVTTLRFILSPVVVLSSSGISIERASLQFLLLHQPLWVQRGKHQITSAWVNSQRFTWDAEGDSCAEDAEKCGACVCVFSYLLPTEYQNLHSTSKVRQFLETMDLLAGPHKLQGLFEG